MQNICLGVQSATSEGGDGEVLETERKDMASLLSASSFYAGVQPTESELMPSADHGGPLLLEGVCPNILGSPPSKM